MTSLLGCLREDVAAVSGGRGVDLCQQGEKRGKVPQVPEVIDGVILQRGERSSVDGAHLLLHHVFPLVRRQAEQILKQHTPDVTTATISPLWLKTTLVINNKNLCTKSSLLGLVSVGRMKMASMGTAPVFPVRSLRPLIQPRCWENSLSLTSTMSSPFLKLSKVGSSVGEEMEETGEEGGGD